MPERPDSDRGAPEKRSKRTIENNRRNQTLNCHLNAVETERFKKNLKVSSLGMVGVTGIEPVTPTMST
jgi:hypothetical protein